MVELRELAVQGLIESAAVDTQVGGRIRQFGAMPEEFPDTPYIIVKFGTRALHSPSWRGGPTEQLVEYWIHDRPGDYFRIDSICELIKLVHEQLPNKEDFVESRFLSVSEDFEDPELRTIFRTVRFLMTKTR